MSTKCWPGHFSKNAFKEVLYCQYYWIGDGMTVDKESFFQSGSIPTYFPVFYVLPILLKFYMTRVKSAERILTYRFGKEPWAIYYYKAGLAKTSVPYSHCIQCFHFTHVRASAEGSKLKEDDWSRKQFRQIRAAGLQTYSSADSCWQKQGLTLIDCLMSILSR